MGCVFSCRSSSGFKKKMVRVVLLNGQVEDFDHPISVRELIADYGDGSPSQQFVCTPTQLLSNYCKGLPHDTMLEAGRVYFLLPYSTLQSDVSSATLASIARRLTDKAKSTQWNAKARSKDRSDSGMNTKSYRPKPKGVLNMGVRTWKPILDTIREKSFNRRESDLQEK